MTNSELIKSKAKELLRTKSAAVFSLGDYFIQLASYNDNEIYCEAVSHNFLDSLSPALEASFRSLGFFIDDGNYYKIYTISSEGDFDKIVNDAGIIFKDYYGQGLDLAFEVEDVE